MSNPDAYNFLRAITGSGKVEEKRSPMTGLSRQAQNEKWMTYQTSGVPMPAASLDEPRPTAQSLQPHAHTYEDRPKIGFYKEVSQQFEQAHRALENYNKKKALAAQAQIPPKE